LKDKTIVITGGAGSVGKSLIKAFLEEEAIIISVDKNRERMDQVSTGFRNSGQRVRSLEADVSDPQSTIAVFQKIREEFGCPDVLINNAGVFSSAPFLDIDTEGWDNTMKTNLRSVLLCSQQAVELMMEREEGTIINIASLGGQIGGIFVGADYSASKAGVICLTKSLAKSYGPYGIRVNCVNPGPLESDMTRTWPRQVLNELRKSMMTGSDQLGTAEELASVVVFLASDKSRLIHGAEIDVNGGIFIH